MNPGKLNKKITFLEPVFASDGIGGKNQTGYNEVVSVWASKNVKSATRKEYMGDYVNYVPVFWIMREPCVPVTASMKLQHGDSLYNILNITKLEGAPKYLEIETQELKPR